MVKTNKYALEPLVKQPSIVPYMLLGERAPQFLNDFNRLIDRKYNGNPNLKVLNLQEIDNIPTITGSNPPILPLVQHLVPERRIARPEDIQRTLNDGDTIGIRGNYYIDFGLSLDFSGNNHDLALDFFNQLPKGIKRLDKLPAIVLGYGLKNSKKGEYGFAFKFEKNTRLRYSPILLKQTGQFSDEDVSLETGLPSKLGSGNRRFYTTNQKEKSLDNLGFSRFCLDWGLDLYASNDGLADSDGRGRMVLV